MRKKTGKIVSTVMIPFLLVIFVLIVGCQGGGTSQPAETPTQEATIEATSEPSPSPTETEEAMPAIEATFERRTHKDPFMPVVGKQGAETAAVETPVQPTEAPPTPGGGTPEVSETPGETGNVAIVTPKAKKAKIVEVPSEEVGVDVRGILKTGGGYRAILASEGGTSYVVQAGQKVGEWTVSSIDSQNVVLTAKGFKAKLHLQTEDLSPGEGSKKIKSVEGPKVPAPPKEEGGEDAPPPPE